MSMVRDRATRAKFKKMVTRAGEIVKLYEFEMATSGPNIIDLRAQAIRDLAEMTRDIAEYLVEEA
jgi:recombinational DNA repair ATPase RecF